MRPDDRYVEAAETLSKIYVGCSKYSYMLCFWLSPLSRQGNHLSNTCRKDLTFRRGNHVHLTSSPKCLVLVAAQRWLVFGHWAWDRCWSLCVVSEWFSCSNSFHCTSISSAVFLLYSHDDLISAPRVALQLTFSLGEPPPSQVLEWTLSYCRGPSTLQRPSGANLTAVSLFTESHYHVLYPSSCFPPLI